MDMCWEIVRNGEDSDGELLEVNAWLGPRQPSPPVHVHDNAEDSFEIVEGRLDVKLDGTWRTYGPGERAAARSARAASPTQRLGQSRESLRSRLPVRARSNRCGAGPRWQPPGSGA